MVVLNMFSPGDLVVAEKTGTIVQVISMEDDYFFTGITVKNTLKYKKGYVSDCWYAIKFKLIGPKLTLKDCL